MPRRRAAPRLWLDRKRNTYVIRDGGRFLRCSTASLEAAEQQLAAYIGAKHTPQQRGSDPLISDVLLVYWNEHLSRAPSETGAVYRVKFLARWWGHRVVSDITPRACREYGSSRKGTGTRKDLEVLQAGIRYWHRHYGPLATLPAVILPARESPRERWLTRSELARLLWAARKTEHLRRFILLAYYTGSRSGVVLGLTWRQIDASAGIMSRRADGVREKGKKRSPPVRLGRRILLHLRRWQSIDARQSEYVIRWEGRPISRINKATGAFKQAVKRAGLSDVVTPHTLRHTCATHLMQAGVDIWEAAGFLGMTVETLTNRYGHHHPDHQKNAAEALSAPNRSRTVSKPLK